MQKPALKTDLDHMSENQYLKTRVKLIFANFWKPAQALKRWK
jgi:hypothetical protein